MHKLSPEALIGRFRLSNNIYLLGSFEAGLTIYKQQVRALNLVWSMIEALPRKRLERVAVVGGGFAGLTAAAALLHKGVRHVAIFEQRATLCPLQDGSDTRWVHPGIYDWPDAGSDTPAAALPLLNWSAGRASDVVVEVMDGWGRILGSKASNQSVSAFLNVKHLRIDRTTEIEWVGEEQVDGATRGMPSGNKSKFQSVILAVGFGLEPTARFSYWRNEQLGQPELVPGKRTYLVSGQGDGALVDLFRIRIARFRQDRILFDLFAGNTKLVNALRKLKRDLVSTKHSPVLYREFERIASNPAFGFKKLLVDLQMRLRTDTAVVLQMSPGIDTFKNIFKTPASFQNRFLLFALYKAGGLIPTTQNDEKVICDQYGIAKDDIVRRHGPKRRSAVEQAMDQSLLNLCRPRIGRLEKNSRQPSTICWSGGYWHTTSDKLRTKPADDDRTKATWRREYLPQATETFVTAFTSAVAGYLEALGSAGNDFRVTLHRTLYVGSEVLLQQASRYAGRTERLGEAGRALGFSNGTIGYAATAQKIIRTQPRAAEQSDSAYRDGLKRDMQRLNLTQHAQSMASGVRSLMAVPILAADKKHVLGVLFADSTKVNVFTDRCVGALTLMCQHFAEKIEEVRGLRVENFSVPALTAPKPPRGLTLEILQALDKPTPPRAPTAQYLNLEFIDFVSIKEGAI
jgi:GAF domain-containing protein